VSSLPGEFDAALSDAAARRMSNQLNRAFRGTYGATTGLRTIVQSIARQMLRAGSSPEATALTFERYVLDHPFASGDEPQHLTAGKTDSQLLVELTRECVAEVVVEVSAVGIGGG
jgi:hypothetical protein